MTNDYSVGVRWYSKKEGRVIEAYGHDLDPATFHRLCHGIQNRSGDWEELRSVIRQHEGQEFSYILNNSKVAERNAIFYILLGA